MITSPLKYFDSRTMGFKLTVVFVIVILIPMGLLAYVSYRVFDKFLVQEAYERIDLGLKAAWREYYVRGEQMRYGMLQAASMKEIREAVARRDTEYLKKMMSRWKLMRPYVDLWSVVDSNGKVIVRLNSDFTGDELDLNGIVSNAITVGEPLISTEIISKDMLKKEWSGLQEMLFSSNVSTGEKDAVGDEVVSSPDAMTLTVVTPVFTKGNKVAGAIVTGDIINNDPYIPDTISSKIKGLFTTVSLNGVRVTTNLIDGAGRNVRHSVLPGDILEELRSGGSVFREWSLPGMTYMSIYEPIRDNKGKIIGSIDVAVSKERLWNIQKKSQWIIAVITLLGMSVSILAAMISTYRITKPLKVLRSKIGDFAEGDMYARVGVEDDLKGRDELKALARTFNTMMDVVSRREGEKERYLKEIETKNVELIELNDELKSTNEELEVAYEETQSQTEELHAINEELKLLNEDLDRKNAELKKANRIITMEEAELKAAKNKLRLIYDSIRDYVLLVDYDCRLLEANRYLKETFELDDDGVLGLQLFKLFGMEDPGENCPIKRSIEDGTPVDMEFTTFDGKVLMLHSYPFAGENTGPGMAVAYIKDITDQRLLTQQLIQSDKLSSLGELVSGVAHELNNPLTGIMCFSELLMEEGFPGEVRKKLEKINSASHRCKKIIDNLLTFARWHTPEKRSEDINKIISESVELREYQLKLDNISVELDLDDSVPLTMLDANQIQQVFLNLINNARDAMLENGGGNILVSSSHEGDRIVVKFEDTGAGMSDEVVSKIFDPFFTTKEVGKGTGLGLSISYGIINEHGGSIYATSKPGIGTSFAVELPVVSDPAECGAVTGLEDGLDRLKAAAPGLKAFVLDDEQIVLELVKDTLMTCGFEVECTMSGFDALRKIKENDYDIIISDIKMPGLSGRHFYEEVKKCKPECIRRIVFISGDSVSAETRAFLEEIECFNLRKPFTVDDLAKTVLMVVENKSTGVS